MRARPQQAPIVNADDAALVPALVRRESGAEEAACHRFAPVVRGTVRRLLGPSRDEDDVVQEVLLRFFSTVERLREPAAVRHFLFGICVRVVRKEVRRKMLRSWLRLAPVEEMVDWPAVAGDADAREAIRRFYAVLDALGNDSRSLFVVRYIEGKDLGDVARIHGISVSTVQRKLARALKRVTAMVRQDPLLAGYATEQLFGGEA